MIYVFIYQYYDDEYEARGRKEKEELEEDGACTETLFIHSSSFV